MKIMKGLLAWTAGACCYVLGALALMAYDNAEMHPTINNSIVDTFIKNFVHALTPPAALNGYLFVLDGSRTYTGPGVTKAGYFASGTTEGDLAKTPRAWIAHGGYSADIPEVPAALRHFFDPLGIDGGKTWLTDRGTYWEWIVNNNAINPRINARDWALTHDENPWSFSKGKQWMLKALEEEDETARDGYMARAWRCLGETLHLVADMGCPVHVRNDSHAHVVDWQYRRAFGDPDPYEVLVTPAMASKYANGAVDPALKSSFRTAKSAMEIFNVLATFTNANFFTNQTISGMGVKQIDPIITGRPAYPAPKLEQLSYDPADFTFYKTFPGGQKVKMCKDRSFWSFRGYPYIDADCVESQASVLMPNVMEAGANVMRLFIPHVQVKIATADAEGTVTGSVSHIATEEYASPVVCQGMIQLFVDNEVVGEGLLEEDGTFRLEGLPLEKDDPVVAGYSVGGILVRSAPVKAGDAGILDQLQTCNTVLVEFGAKNRYTHKDRDETVSMGLDYLRSGIGLQPMQWNGASFSFTLDHEQLKFTITGTMSADGRTLMSIDVQWDEIQDDGRYRKRIELRASQLPYTKYNISPFADFVFGDYYPGAGQFLEHFSLTVSQRSDPSEYSYVETLWDANAHLHVKFFK